MRITVVLLALLPGAGLWAAQVDATRAEPSVEEVIVTASVLEGARGLGSGSAVSADEIALVRAGHAYEIFARLPGVWVSRGSEQEHLTAIRSPVFSGAGACGEFQVLENGIPIRPAGFCNVNNLFELNTEQAGAIEVLRGAGGARFGGNAVHGVVNVVSAGAIEPGPTPWRIAVEGGPYEYGQVRVSGAGERAGQRLRLDVLATDTNGYRDATGHSQQKANVSHLGNVGGFEVRTLLSGTNLEQETGGFVIGYRAYDDSKLRKTNPNPEAFRDAWSSRLVSEWRRTLDSGVEVRVTPFVRRSSMRFLQHFLPGQPLEENSQTSAGLQAAFAGGDVLEWRGGWVGEWAQGDLYEFQAAPAAGSAFIQATRPVGVHYDYDVTSLMTAGYYDVRYPLSDRLDVIQGGRIEWIGYDYTNHGLDGNTRDDGTPCGFGGCLYTRPADREDDFLNAAGRLGVDWAATPSIDFYALAATGFRPPQVTELYRLQSGQSVADLASERVASLELGGRGAAAAMSAAVALFAERTEDLVLRDANGFNVSGGEIDSYGVELEADWTPAEGHDLHVALTWARHQYGFDRQLAGGEQIENGKDVDTAPRWLGSAQWRYAPSLNLESELEVVYQGEHWINAENTARYPGHSIVNWRGSWRIDGTWRLFARVVNLTDEKYADRADFAFGNYRYFPAMPLQVYAGFELTLGRRS